MPKPSYTPLANAKDVNLSLQSSNIDEGAILALRSQALRSLLVQKAEIKLIELIAISPASELLRYLNAPEFLVNEMQQRERGVRYEEYAKKYMQVFNMNEAVLTERERRMQIANDLQRSLSIDSKIYNVPYKTPNWYTERASDIKLVRLYAEAPTSEILRDLCAPAAVIYEMQIHEQATKLKETVQLPHPTVRM